MKKLLLMLALFVSIVPFSYGQGYPFVFPSNKITGSVSKYSPSGPIQQVAAPLIINIAPNIASLVNEAFQLSVPPVDDINNVPSASMFTFTIASGTNRYNGSLGLLSVGQSASVYVNVDTSKLNAGEINIPIFVQDATSGLYQSVILDLTVLDNTQYAFPPSSLRVVPHIATGYGWTTTLIFTNTSAQINTSDVIFFGTDGNALFVKLDNDNVINSIRLTLPGHGVTSLVLKDVTSPVSIAGNVQVNLIQGTSLSVRAFYTSLSNNLKVSVEGQNPNSNTLVMYYDETQGKATGIAVSNTFNFPQDVILYYYDNDGSLLTQNTITIPANGEYVSTLAVPEINGHVGSIMVVSQFKTLSGVALVFDSNFNFITVTADQL